MPKQKGSKTKKVPEIKYDDDTPKSFVRLMAFAKTGKGPRKGLDDGVRGVKRKRVEESTDSASNPKEKEDSKQAPPPLKIQPGERLSEFAARVNQALPLSGLSTKGKKVEGAKERQTKHGKRLRKMQQQWREDDVRIKEKEEEEREEAEEKWDEQLAGLDKDARAVMLSNGKVGGKKKSKRRNAVGEIDDDDDDPWAVLNQKRDAPRGVFDVNTAPPKFEKIPREIFKGVKVKDVPKEAGSLRRREDVGQARVEIIKSYRAMMAAKRT